MLINLDFKNTPFFIGVSFSKSFQKINKSNKPSNHLKIFSPIQNKINCYLIVNYMNF